MNMSADSRIYDLQILVKYILVISDVLSWFRVNLVDNGPLGAEINDN